MTLTTSFSWFDDNDCEKKKKKDKCNHDDDDDKKKCKVEFGLQGPRGVTGLPVCIYCIC
jgi:hypothetical protein